jgi:hypothetical protein
MVANKFFETTISVVEGHQVGVKLRNLSPKAEFFDSGIRSVTTHGSDQLSASRWVISNFNFPYGST